ncbi:MAG: aldose 1-epimerase [Pseudomonadota bacterium]
MTVTLSHKAFELVLAPSFGGSVLSFKYAGADLLRPAATMTPENWDARRTAAFPMVPFCGRITNGEFTINQLTVKLPANMPPEPHAIHGFGWQANWTCTFQSAREAVLEFDASNTGWPWPFMARQHFSLADEGLSLELSLTNLGDTPMPGGFGWHPYFPKQDAQLRAGVQRIWLASDEAATDHAVSKFPEFDLRTRKTVEDITLDHAFTVETLKQRLIWPDRTLELSASDLFQHLVVYVPPEEDAFCVEPISHVPNAVNMPRPKTETGLKVLKPGENLIGTVRLVLTNTP